MHTALFIFYVTRYHLDYNSFFLQHLLANLSLYNSFLIFVYIFIKLNLYLTLLTFDQGNFVQFVLLIICGVRSPEPSKKFCWSSQIPCCFTKLSLTISQRVFELIIKILWKLFCCNPDFYGISRSQICTSHESLAVMTCAKLWPDLIIIFHARAAYIYFCHLWIMSL